MELSQGSTVIAPSSTFTEIGGNVVNHFTGSVLVFNSRGGSSDDPPRGLVYTHDDRTLYQLPLEQVDIDVLIVDVSSRITLKQTFANPSQIATGHAKYVFPVPARAAVCAFEMQFEDGRVITGIAKEKTSAAKEFQEAVRAGKPSGLVEWVTDDAFVISVGAIPAVQTVTTNLVFVMELEGEIKDEVRLQLPMYLGSRYGEEPTTLAAAASASIQTRLCITVDIQMSGVIQKVTSHTHPDISVAPYLKAGGQKSLRRQTARWRSPTFLAKSFVLAIGADGLDAARCFAEKDPKGSTVAMQLTLVPNVTLPPVLTQEYIFLVDRSGSMDGPSITIVKQALVMLLRMLPSEQTFFNIYSFGSRITGIWKYSQPYSQHTVDLGTGHIDDMKADYGGTELRGALEFVFQKRKSTISTVVFVLTDGEIYACDEVIAAVGEAVACSTPEAPLRVFALGIGHQVSTAVVEGIARAGNGEYLFAVENESIQNKCARLLRAGRSPCVENISVDWGFADSLQTSTQHNDVPSDFSNSDHVQLGPPHVQQSPSYIPKLLPGSRITVFLLTTHKNIPRQVVLHGKLRGADAQVMVVVPVSSVKKFNRKGPDIPLIHTLSARHLIADLVEDKATLPKAKFTPATTKDIRKAAIIQLGETYQLASRYTSFVAVDTYGPPSRDKQMDDEYPGAFGGTVEEWQETDSASTDTSSTHSFLYDSALHKNPSGHPPSPANSPTEDIWAVLGSQLLSQTPRRHPSELNVTSLPSYFSSDQGTNIALLPTFSQYQQNAQSPLLGMETTQYEEGIYLGSRDRDLRDLDSIQYISEFSAERYSNTSAPQSRSGFYRSVRIRRRGARSQHHAPSPEPSPVPEEVLVVVRLQHADGSFSLSQDLGSVVGPSLMQKPADIHDATIWATAVAVAFLQKHLTHPSQSDVLDGIMNKVWEFIRDKLDRTAFTSLVDRVYRDQGNVNLPTSRLDRLKMGFKMMIRQKK